MALIRPIGGSFTSSLSYLTTPTSISGKKVYFSVTRSGGAPSLSIDSVAQTATGMHSEADYTIYTYEASNLNNATVSFDGRVTVVTID